MSGTSPRSIVMAVETEHRPIKNPIRERRKGKGLSTVQLAWLVDVTPVRITHYESGHKPPDKRLETLARALGVGVDQLRSELTNYWDSFYESAAVKAGLGAGKS